MPKFQRTTELPRLQANRQDFYDLAEGLQPTSDAVDPATLVVQGGKFASAWSVPRWVKATVTFSQLQAPAASTSVDLFTGLPGLVVHAVKVKASTAFAGTGITEVNVDVGVTGAPDKYLSGYDVAQAVGDTEFDLESVLEGETHGSSGTAVRLRATAVGDTLDKLTAGSVDVWVLASVTE